MRSIGIDLGGTTIKFLVLDCNNSPIKGWEIPTKTDNYGEAILSDIIREIRSYLKTNEIDNGDISVIGIGVPGPVDSKRGIVKVAINIGWEEVNVRKILEEALNIPVFVLNDANAAAIGEKFINPQKADNVLFVTLGTGVGGGIIINNQLIVGPGFSSGEIGHIPLNMKEKRVCGCGNINCLETFASAQGLLKTVEGYRALNTSFLADNLTTHDFFEELKNGSKIAESIFKQYCNQLATGLAAVVNSIDIELIIIGGGLSNAGDILIDGIKKSIIPKLFSNHKRNLMLEKAKLGNEAGAIGTVIYGLEKRR